MNQRKIFVTPGEESDTLVIEFAYGVHRCGMATYYMRLGDSSKLTNIMIAFIDKGIIPKEKIL